MCIILCLPTIISYERKALDYRTRLAGCGSFLFIIESISEFYCTYALLGIFYVLIYVYLFKLLTGVLSAILFLMFFSSEGKSLAFCYKVLYFSTSPYVFIRSLFPFILFNPFYKYYSCFLRSCCIGILPRKAGELSGWSIRLLISLVALSMV